MQIKWGAELRFDPGFHESDHCRFADCSGNLIRTDVFDKLCNFYGFDGDIPRRAASGDARAPYTVLQIFTVIEGWFLTVIIAMTVSIIFAFLIDLGGMAAIIGLFILALIFRTGPSLCTAVSGKINRRKTRYTEQLQSTYMQYSVIYSGVTAGNNWNDT